MLAAQGVPGRDGVSRTGEGGESRVGQRPVTGRAARQRRRRRGQDRLASQVDGLAQEVRDRGGYDIVEVGYNSLREPSVSAAITRVISQGAGRVIVVPTALTNSYSRLEKDAPRVVSAAQEEHPQAQIIYAGPPFNASQHADLLVTKIREYDRAASAREDELGLAWLSDLRAGEAGKIHDFVAGHGLVSRLSALGFTPGARVTMVQNFGHGPLIVRIRGSRIALGRGEAARVRIRRTGYARQG